MWVELVLFAYTDDEAHIALTVRVASVELDLLSSHMSNQSVQRTAGVRLFWVLSQRPAVADLCVGDWG